MASSTIIPKPNSNAKSTMKFRVTVVPIMPSAIGRNMKATKTLNGTLSATKKALVTPMKNINTISTKMKPIMMVFTKSLKEVLVDLLKSPVMTTFKFLGSSSFCFSSSTIFFILSAALIKFSPLRFTMLSVTTFLPSKRA